MNIKNDSQSKATISRTRLLRNCKQEKQTKDRNRSSAKNCIIATLLIKLKIDAHLRLAQGPTRHRHGLATYRPYLCDITIDRLFPDNTAILSVKKIACFYTISETQAARNLYLQYLYTESIYSI